MSSVTRSPFVSQAALPKASTKPEPQAAAVQAIAQQSLSQTTSDSTISPSTVTSSPSSSTTKSSKAAQSILKPDHQPIATSPKASFGITTLNAFIANPNLTVAIKSSEEPKKVDSPLEKAKMKFQAADPQKYQTLIADLKKDHSIQAEIIQGKGVKLIINTPEIKDACRKLIQQLDIAVGVIELQINVPEQKEKDFVVLSSNLLFLVNDGVTLTSYTTAYAYVMSRDSILKSLDLSKIKTLSNDQFKSILKLANELEKLSIASDQIEAIPTRVAKKLTYLSCIGCTKLKGGTFKSLKTLVCDENFKSKVKMFNY